MEAQGFKGEGTRGRVLLFLVGLALMLAMAAGLALAQEPEPEFEGEVSIPADLEAIASGAIPIQGRLTSPGGAPLNGTFSITFRLYDVSSGGAALCTDNNNVTVANGLFSSYIDGCYNQVTGQRLYLGVQVGSDPEMTPRQVIYAVPYALSLVPGAVISYTTDGVLTVRSTGTGDYDALLAYAADVGEAIEARAIDGVAVFANSQNYVAVQAYSYPTSTVTSPAIFGCAADSAATCDPYRDDDNAGVMGYSKYGFGGRFTGGDGGVYAEGNAQLSPAVWAKNSSGAGVLIENSSTGSGNATLYLVQGNSGGDFVVGASSYLGARYWRVDRTGRGFFNNGTQTGGADFAEQIAVEGEEADYQVGDVLVISATADRTVARASRPFDTAVVGVYSERPASWAARPIRMNLLLASRWPSWASCRAASRRRTARSRAAICW